ncbi:MAG TPA: MerR family transcriptional regulator [Anaerolineaceae bacterium]|nr:MerR family transcriptional regulator [Anaerolineaceae bacterium]HPN53666.1 MerR family transcriptional regulator [Anaerolineaceae bacterium]
MSYTVKQLCSLAGVTPRTLHYYDEIGLLRPASYGDNGYRCYGEDAVLRLQQILFYRELDFSLDQIKTILDHPGFDLLRALESHRQALQAQAGRIDRLIHTVDNTIRHLRGEINMSKRDFYSGFDEEKQARYEQQVRQQFGDEAMARTKNWNAYTPAEKNDILADLHEIGENTAANMDRGFDSPEVQYWIGRWHQAINTYFYPCSLEIFESLGHMYVENPEFTATYEKIRPGMAAFMEKAMAHYCKVMASREA